MNISLAVWVGLHQLQLSFFLDPKCELDHIPVSLFDSMVLNGKGCAPPRRSHVHQMWRAAAFRDEYARPFHGSNFSYGPMRLRRPKLDI